MFLSSQYKIYIYSFVDNIKFRFWIPYICLQK